MRWRLNLKEFSPELIDIKGSKNIVADAPSHLHKIGNLNKKNNKVNPTLESLSHNFALNKEDVLHITTFKTIIRFQQRQTINL